MLSIEEALALATRSMNDRYNARLTDFDTVCVVEFTHRLPPDKPVSVDSEATAEIRDSNPDTPKEASGLPVGASPVLIDKRSGEVYPTGSDVLYAPEDYAACYLATGSPRGKPTSEVIISGPPDAGDNDAVIDTINAVTALGPASIRMRLRQIGLARQVEFETPDSETAKTLAGSLRELGIDARQNWISDSPGSVGDSQLFEVDDTDITVDFDEFTREEK